MKELLSELYQVLGELDAPAKVLDQVAAAIAGQPLPHATLLPFAVETLPVGYTTGTMHGDVNGNTFFEVKLVGRRRLPFMGQALYVGAPPSALPDGDLPDAVIQATAEAIGSAYDCMRVWSAWGVGTMGPDDFLPVADDSDRVAEIARASIGAWLADQRKANEPAREAVPAAPAVKESLTADQQAEPVAWHTNDPCVSSEHIEAIAKVCKIIPSYTTVEYVARIVGFGHVLLADKSVQEAFVRANSHLLRTDAAQPPAVAGAVPDGYALVPIKPTDSMLDAAVSAGDEPGSDYYTIYAAMLAAAPQAATEGCGACGDGCQGQGCRLELESPPTCQKCNGAGVIRGLLSNGGGSYAEPCPDCTAPEPTAEDSSAVRDAVTVPDEWRSPSNTPVVALGDALHCWLAVKSKHDSKVRVYDAYFCNFPLMQDEAGDFPDWTLHDESGEEVAMVGWAEKVAHPDFNDFYSALGDIELIGWQPVNPPVAPTAAQKGGA